MKHAMVILIVCILAFCMAQVLKARKPRTRTRSPPRKTPPPPPPTPTLDHLWLVYTWPSGYCARRQSTCRLAPLPAKLILHGMWLVDQYGSLLMNCQQRITFFPSVFKGTFYNNMVNNWAALGSEASDKKGKINFWTHEYNEHGNCFPTGGPSLNYFSKALRMKNENDIHGALIAAMVSPGAVHQRSAFEAAIQAKLGTTKIIMFCFTRPNGQKALTEIAICFDQKGDKAIACPEGDISAKDSCGNTAIEFPAAVA